MRALPLGMLGLCIAAVACESSLAPTPASIELQVDSVITVGATATAAVVGRDAHGNEVRTAAAEWEILDDRDGFGQPLTGSVRQVLSIAPQTAVVTARAVGRAWLVARVGDLRDSVLVHAETTLTHPIAFTLGTFEVAPGAQFYVGATNGGYPVLDPFRQGRWFTSDSTVAGWTPNYSFHRLIQLTMRQPGRATVGVEYGGQRGTMEIVVRDPGPMTTDEAGICGLNDAGELWCKGSNAAARLATLTATDFGRATRQQDSPVAVRGAPGMTFTMITGDGGQACGINRADGRAYCWGLNAPPLATTGYRLGGPSSFDHCPEGGLHISYARYSCSFVPLAVDRLLSTPLQFRTIKSVSNRTCGVTVGSEEIWCWGDTDVPTRREAVPAGWPAWP